MKHDLESEAKQNAAIVALAHTVAGLSAHAGFTSGVSDAHAVVKSMTEDEPPTPEPVPSVAQTPEPVPTVADAPASKRASK